MDIGYCEFIKKKGATGDYNASDMASMKNFIKMFTGTEVRDIIREVFGDRLNELKQLSGSMIKEFSEKRKSLWIDDVEEVVYRCIMYVVMDYIEGESLDKILQHNGAQPQERVIEWAKQLCAALLYLHSQNPPVIYRDMKPANVMLKPEGNLKVIDFGIAREYKVGNLADAVSLGTRGYAAPEQFGGKGQTDERTDIYGLGITLYHLVTGQNLSELPYEIYPIRKWNPSLSSGLEAIIQKCTQLNPADRYQSCGELMYALEHYTEMDDTYKKKQKRKLGVFIASVAMTVLMLASGILFMVMHNNEKKKNYNHMINISVSTSYDEKVNTYLEAIDLYPYRTEAYLKLV